MSTVQIFDKPMCCSSGVCGPQVDPVLPRFAADLEWLKTQGNRVDRFNLAQQPQEFTGNAEVQKLLSNVGVDCLPLIFIDGRIVSRGEYPSRQDLALWTKTNVQLASFQVERGGCCGGAVQPASDACCTEDEKAKLSGDSGCGCSESGCC